MKLVIVESPNKEKTISKYLGSNYKVKACIGHFRELANSGLNHWGVDVKNNFKPDYILDPKRSKTINDIIKIAEKADEVILASDPDREGEAIAWHLTQVLNLPIETATRWRFHEITKNAINHEKDNPSTIDMNLVHAQETRRIIDRICGYQLSGLVSSKNKYYQDNARQSAGRVQSATLKFIADREFEILKFVPEEYWAISGDFGNSHILANLTSYNGSSLDKKIKDENQLNKIESILKNNDFIIDSINEENKAKSPRPAFTTSTLQQEAFNCLNFNIKKTMDIAKELFEGILIEDSLIGLITYIRTDSNRLAPEFISSANKFIKENYGENYIDHPHITTEKSDKVQDAHEAIRPTDISLTPEKIKKYLSNEQYRLYELIYDRALASLMKPRIDKVMTLKINNSGYVFTSESRALVFDGYSKVYGKYESYGKELFNSDCFKVGETIKLNELKKEKKETQGPRRYTEASAVRKMEELGIGRPSTYVETIKKLLDRKYINSVKGTLIPSSMGMYLSCRLTDNFPEVMGASFTSNMEQNLDKVAENELTELKVLTDFYDEFEKSYKEAEVKMNRNTFASTDLLCSNCGGNIIFKYGKYGPYMVCEKCSQTLKLHKEKIIEGEFCPKCGGQIVERFSDKTGEFFKGCSKCSYICNQNEYIDQLCPKCGSKLKVRTRGRTKFVGCSAYPNCSYMQDMEGNPIERKNPIDLTNAPICPRCKKGKLVEKRGRYGTYICCTSCKYNPNSKKQ